MINVYALEPKVVATWGRREEFRFIHDKFGLGTPRALLEFPQFSKWKKAVYTAANAIHLSDQDLKRIELLFRRFEEHKYKRADAVYDGLLSWLQNAEHEYDRRKFAGIISSENPRGHQAVIVADQLNDSNAGWYCETGATPSRTPESITAVLDALLVNCKSLYLVDPHFGPENPRHSKVLKAMIRVFIANGHKPDILRIYCSAKTPREFFSQEASKMASWLPRGISIEFTRLQQRSGGEKFHNRYALTELGGVSLGTGLDEGEPGETDDIHLLTRKQYELRWAQYVGNDGAFDIVDTPSAVHGCRNT